MTQNAVIICRELSEEQPLNVAKGYVGGYNCANPGCNIPLQVGPFGIEQHRQHPDGMFLCNKCGYVFAAMLAEQEDRDGSSVEVRFSPDATDQIKQMNGN
jgi:hypothetical protein